MSKIACSSRESYVVETPQGKLLGAIVPNSDISVFKGIPYAVPPVGGRRWKPAEPAPNWQGLRLAVDFGPECVQLLIPETSLYYRPASLQSEDCLYLNIWTQVPVNDSAVKRPVMVWIHGGGLQEGAGSLCTYDGAELSRKGVVVVTFNYRLGIFGYFAHPELSDESPHNSSGNYGITDQIQALKWVQENIASFGGDPDNVSLFGESAGAWSISHLMASPLAKGLFHKAIAQSGAYFWPMRELKVDCLGKCSAETQGERFAKQVTGKEGHPSLVGLRQLTALELQQTALQTGIPVPGELAIVDGWVLPRPVYDTFLQGKQHDIPVLVGFNADEGSGLSDYHLLPPVPENAAQYSEIVQTRFGDLVEDYLAQYSVDNLQDAVYHAHRDGSGVWCMESWARLMRHTSSNAWLYYFSHTPPGAESERSIPPGNMTRRVGALHAGEIPYVFNNIRTYIDDLRLMPNWPTAPAQDDDIALAEAMSDYWVAFAKSGEPKATGLPEWKPYTEKTKHYMAFNQGATPGTDLLPGAWDIQEKIYQRRRELGLFWTDSDFGLNADLRADATYLLK